MGSVGMGGAGVGQTAPAGVLPLRSALVDWRWWRATRRSDEELRGLLLGFVGLEKQTLVIGLY